MSYNLVSHTRFQSKLIGSRIKCFSNLFPVKTFFAKNPPGLLAYNLVLSLARRMPSGRSC